MELSDLLHMYDFLTEEAFNFLSFFLMIACRAPCASLIIFKPLTTALVVFVPYGTMHIFFRGPI